MSSKRFWLAASLGGVLAMAFACSPGGQPLGPTGIGTPPTNIGASPTRIDREPTAVNTSPADISASPTRIDREPTNITNAENTPSVTATPTGTETPGGTPTGTGTPTASPTTAPTATPVPTLACPPTLTVTYNTPFLLSAYTTIKPELRSPATTYGRNCLIDKTEISVRLTTAKPSVAHKDDGTTPSGPNMYMFFCGQGIGSSGCGSGGTLIQFPDPPGGVVPGQVIGGAACGALTFADDATDTFLPYSSPAPPYAGRFKFQLSSFDKTFAPNWDLNSSLTVANSGGGPTDLTVQCVNVTFTTKVVATPTP